MKGTGSLYPVYCLSLVPAPFGHCLPYVVTLTQPMHMKARAGATAIPMHSPIPGVG